MGTDQLQAVGTPEPADASPQGGGFAGASATVVAGEPAAGDLERSIKAHGIGFDGLRFDYHGYRYDRLADALAYAHLMDTRPPAENPRGAYRTGPPVTGPSEGDRKLMTALAIRYEDGMYRFGTFRYDRLADASNYARLVGQRKRDSGGVTAR